MTIFEHFKRVDEQIAKIYNDNLPMQQYMPSYGLYLESRSLSGHRPMSQIHRDEMGSTTDFDRDVVQDSADFHFRDGQFDPNSF